MLIDFPMLVSREFYSPTQPTNARSHFASWVSCHANIGSALKFHLKGLFDQWFTLSLRETEPMLKYDPAYTKVAHYLYTNPKHLVN